jgi:hypothetical protein
MLSRIDRILGRFTMYRLTLLLLIVLAAVSLALSAAGLLAFTPAELGGTLGVAVLSSWGGTRVMALMLRSRPHNESSIITGLILYFVMFPAATAEGLGGVAVAGLAAAASKYLIAVRGRHIVNPAAAGAVTATLFGVSAAGWWVANAYLLPLVAAGAAVLLYRTRKLLLGAVFIGLATALLVAGLVSGGVSPLEGASLVLTSYPVLFLAGFMLSEPLTLPPLRWQQLLIAVIVAVLFAAQISIGPVLLGPEFALVIGNAVAFLLGQRRGIRLSFTSSRPLTPTSTELSFRPAHPVRFKAGQYVELDLPHERTDLRGSRRVFSITSAPQDTGLSLGPARLDAGSSFKKTLLGLSRGATVRGTAGGGRFPAAAGSPVSRCCSRPGNRHHTVHEPTAGPRGALRGARRRARLYGDHAEESPTWDELEALGVPVVLFADRQPRAASSAALALRGNGTPTAKRWRASA